MRVLLIALLLVTSAQARNPRGLPNGGVQLTWTAPTQNSDGSSITDPISYNIYEAPGNAVDGSSAPLVLVRTGVTATSVTISGTSATLYYFAFSAVVDGVEGPLSTDIYVTTP